MKHYKEILNDLVDTSLKFLHESGGDVARLVLIDDLHGKFRFLIFTEKEESIRELVRRADAIDPDHRYWTGETWHCHSQTSRADRSVYEQTWEEAKEWFVPQQEEEDSFTAVSTMSVFRWLDRTRTRTAWFHFREPVWPILDEANPPIALFYSFKGGMGRTTALASQAMAFARSGKRVVVLDMDFDAPGGGSLFSGGPEEKAYYGIVDALLENPGPEDLSDYYYRVTREDIVGPGELFVFPTGVIDEQYVSRLSKLDLENRSNTRTALHAFLVQIRETISPDLILIDARAGLADSSGLLLSGLAHFYLLFTTAAKQSLSGIELVVQHLGLERILEHFSQTDCRLVHSMLPQDLKQQKDVSSRLLEWSEEFFRVKYYLESGLDEEGWTVDDMEELQAPHNPIQIEYNPGLSTYDDIAEVRPILLDSPGYRELFETLTQRFTGTALWQSE